jgi:hypothetical protein
VLIKAILFFTRELILQGWMKPGRDDLAPNVAFVSRRFNEVSKFFQNQFIHFFFGRCVV